MTRAERIGTFEPGSDAWHATRAEGIGASEIAAVVGLSPYESHFSLWHRKAGLVGPQPVNELMSWGHYLEPAIAARFADEHPELRVRRTGTWRSRQRPWQLANPDRLLHGWRDGEWLSRIPVEIKWSPHADGWSDEDEGIPVYYRCQVQWQMDVMGASHAYVAALVGSSYREYRIAYDPDDVEVLRRAGQDFMDSLTAGVPPDIDETGHTYQVLREMHPEIEDREEEIPLDVALAWPVARAKAKAAAADARLWTNKMLGAMGAARIATSDGQRIARRQPAKGGTVALYEMRPPKNPKTIKEATQK